MYKKYLHLFENYIFNYYASNYLKKNYQNIFIDDDWNWIFLQKVVVMSVARFKLSLLNQNK